VIVPNYNHAPYLAQRIDSVLRQTYNDFEVIILDDASSDESMAIIERYAHDGRVRIQANTVNSGSACRQWNRGIREARGEYVWIAESDDFADLRFLETLVARLDACPNAGLAYCDSYRVSAGGEILSRQSDYYRRNDAARWKTDFERPGYEEVRDHLMFWNTIPNASAVLVRKGIYERVGGAPEDLRLCGDWLTWIKILLISDLVYVAAPLNSFRWHGGTVRGSTGNVLSLEEHYRVLRYVVDCMEIGRRPLMRACNRIAAAWVCSLLERPCRYAWQHFGDVYRMALSVDKHPWVRLLKQFCLYCPRKMLDAGLKYFSGLWGVSQSGASKQ
jgi:glycosyltransferase involved in cell wall biosynthesis